MYLPNSSIYCRYTCYITSYIPTHMYLPNSSRYCRYTSYITGYTLICTYLTVVDTVDTPAILLAIHSYVPSSDLNISLIISSFFLKSVKRK